MNNRILNQITPSPSWHKLPREFYGRPTEDVARGMVGKLLILHRPGCQVLSGRIVEVEAYLGLRDKAAHAWRGLTPRTKVLFGPPGHAYVYVIYGMYHCLNVVAEPEGSPGCVLIRAIEPLEGLDTMRANRGVNRPSLLCSGPGRLTQAMGIGIGHYGVDLTAGPLAIAADDQPPPEIAVAPRVGIRDNVDWPLRFVASGSSWLSRQQGK